VFRELFETPFRTGTRNKDFNKKIDWEHYKNTKFIRLIADNFTSRNYKIYKSGDKSGSMFVISSSGYKLGIEYTTKKDILRINTAHSDEPKLFGKFVFFMLRFYKYVSSRQDQSTQAEKAWLHILNKADNVYIDSDTIIKTKKEKIKDLYNTPARIAISEDVFPYSTVYFSNRYLKLLESQSFMRLSWDSKDNYLFPLSIIKGL